MSTVEGAITMAIAISAAFILPDLPWNSKGFTKEELQVAQLRMTEDVGEADEDSAEQGTFDGLFMAVKDYKIYLMMLTFTAYVVGLSFNAYFVSAPARLGFHYSCGLRRLRRRQTHNSLTMHSPVQPTLTGTLGFDYVGTLLMSSPPWVFSCIVSLINAWHADRKQERVSRLSSQRLLISSRIKTSDHRD